LTAGGTITPTAAEYRNFTMRFDGAPTTATTIAMPTLAGYTKVLDFSGADMAAIESAITINVGSANATLSNTFLATGPIVLMSWDGTTISLSPYISSGVETFFNTGSGVTITTTPQTLATVTLTTSANDKLIIDAGSSLFQPSETATNVIYTIKVDGTAIWNDNIGTDVGSWVIYARAVVEVGLTLGSHTIILQASATSIPGIAPTTSNDTIRVLRSAT
jgi:hypothetical protein